LLAKGPNHKGWFIRLFVEVTIQSAYILACQYASPPIITTYYHQGNMMEIADEITIPAPRAEVYAALNDIAILKACIPGCESLERESDTKLVAKVTLKIGPVKAKFNGTVMLDQSKAPDGFSLSGEGEGGLAGFAKGGADVTLTEDGETTILHYSAKAETGGKIAQLGGRLITSTAKKLSKAFFEKFEKIMTGEFEVEQTS
jgi:carbon monoxide dehydrogenase subunit G